MRNFKFIAAMFATVAIMFGMATADVMACTQPFDVMNGTTQDITKITIHYCNGTTHDILNVGPGHVHTTYNIPCGTICEITIEVNGNMDTTIPVPFNGPLPCFPAGVVADQGHIHFPC